MTSRPPCRRQSTCLYREGEDKPVEGQLDIIETLPGDKSFNDFRQVWKVTVPKAYVANSITNSAALLDAGYQLAQTNALPQHAGRA